MSKILVLLESPAKVAKIQHFLSEGFPENEYVVMASGGHINKIADKGVALLGIDLETMTPTFVNEKTKKENISNIKKAGKTADLIVLASDPDREGEAIAWHLANLFENMNKEIKRITFDEITKNAVIKSFENMQEIDQDLVNAQTTRQMLDKIIGYLVSKSLQKSTGLMSAGRVQTPALYILAERAKEINAFVPTPYHKISVQDDSQKLSMPLFKDKNNSNFNDEKTYWITDEIAQNILNELTEDYKCIDYKANAFETRSFSPYSTANMLVDGFSKLKLSTSQITVAAQKLYEAGLVTYIRTDSNRYSADFINDAKTYIANRWDEKLYADPIVKKDNNAQDAHESIRPTDLKNTPDVIETQLSDAVQKRLYTMIWWNTIKSLMHGPSGFNHSWVFDNSGYKFKQTYQEVLNPGYQALKTNTKHDEDIELDDESDEVIKTELDQVPMLVKEKDFVIKIDKSLIKDETTETKPPRMYNPGTLIKELRSLGIGRPSTYNPILTKLKEREYVDFERSKPIEVTNKGFDAEKFLYANYNDFFNLGYTADMEAKLDLISEGKFNNVDWLKETYANLSTKVKEEIEKAKTGTEICPRCHEGTLVFIKTRFGRGRGCSNFTTTKCGYREYQQPDDTWKEYVEPTPEQREENAKKREEFLAKRKEYWDNRRKAKEEKAAKIKEEKTK
ncbi:type IA DNA topoisomerase [Williamsoniiplasma luminosum]|uniref:DNA topoisomerase 1 n=1 Tax=Williamsoniiplasma luminosum TaxID=214888 RepID=A0A2S0NKT5_9MOLU|nr:DNA topoisomerase [Williamsoniiplasma luminosum]AVP49626.1 MAG: type I DNA topoisomerase [Williamsoniiplasma luminosum]